MSVECGRAVGSLEPRTRGRPVRVTPLATEGTYPDVRGSKAGVVSGRKDMRPLINPTSLSSNWNGRQSMRKPVFYWTYCRHFDGRQELVTQCDRVAVGLLADPDFFTLNRSKYDLGHGTNVSTAADQFVGGRQSSLNNNL
jgi:hypothetical protein